MKQEDLYLRSYLDTDGFFDFIESLGGNIAELCEQSGLNPASQSSNIELISWNAMCRFYEIAAETLNEPYLGLKWAKSQPKDYRASGPTLFLGSKSTNLLHFADLCIEYQKIHTNGVVYSYDVNPKTQEVTGIISIHPLSVPCRQFCEQILGTMVVMGRRYIRAYKVNRVTFQHDAPEDSQIYEDYFQCPVEFNADRNTITIDSNLMNVNRASLFTKLMTSFAKSYFTRKIQKQPDIRRSTEQMVAEILPSIMGTKRSDISNVAALMNLHPKKLQRLLKDEGTHYSDILDDVRQGISQRLLTDSNITIDRLAKMLDYASEQSFINAAKRWFGMTPTQYRTQHRKNE